MSRETLAWLNENTLIGFTEKRGKAWHHRQGADNHYAGAVPVEDVRKRLFNWTAEERKVYTATHNPGSGESAFRAVPDRKAVVRSDTGAVLGIFTDSYQIHHYDRWLVSSVEIMLDDDLQIGSAGLLRGGAVAWVQVEVPETIETPDGVRFRPFLLASTSMDGSISTQYSRAVTHVVCDNTMNIALKERHDQRLRVRHSSKSLGRLQDARDALGIIYGAADDFAAEVTKLVGTTMRDFEFSKLMERQVPLPDAKKAAGAHKLAVEKRTLLWDLYRFDERVKPWTGTAFGAWQAFNTYAQHESQVRKNTIRQERNMWRTVKGDQAKADTGVLADILELTA